MLGEESSLDLVEILLIDFAPSSSRNELNGTSTSCDHRISKFREKMSRRVLRNPSLPFEMKFERVHPSKNDIHHTFSNLSYPQDIDISYNHSVILITDCFNQRISVYDLQTKHYKFEMKPLPITYPTTLCIEENYDGQYNDAFIVVMMSDIERVLFKCDLKTLISLNGKQFSSIFQVNQFTFPRGVKVYNKKIHVVDERCIKILSSDTGQLMEVVDLDWKAFDLAIINDHTIAVLFSEGTVNRIEILDAELNWRTIRSFEQELFHWPKSIVMDSAAKRLIVCDHNNGKIFVFSLEGLIYISSFGQREERSRDNLDCPTALCLNEMTGELFVVDDLTNQVLIFK
ncbi:hypothetical protein C9374_009453 [Naegleria lovaniensis]|uniref:Uncharacterized protein n=1 Tax=Naegleria lovaniensis TaxID=51637 RepID=A0AA88H4V4_NAELO|nr:uncharacterized protein C9374_009453 [Naegleria lovaniensis]KAG2392876.1 hypothetical protein C9374_009453 [Naegleria lovaniensis]